MTANRSELGRLSVSGSPRDIGRALGEAGREAVHTVLLQHPAWLALTAPRHAPAVARMGEQVRALFPAIREELAGLAEGLDLPLEQVLAWNCRGDLLAATGDGCTTVQIPGPEPVIGHNEDGLPGLRGHAFIATIQPDDGPGFQSFCYPGSVPGHTFARTDTGLVQAVNNLRLQGVHPSLPRMLIGRAILGCQRLDDALELLNRHNDSGGFHMTLAQAGDPRLMSVEYGGGSCSQRCLGAPAVHANHALHLGVAARNQSITRSSADRQSRGEALLSQGCLDALAMLRESGGDGLPIFRDAPDDPDDENTLATVIFQLHDRSVVWRILDGSGTVWSDAD